jgi:hypothetical protein
LDLVAICLVFFFSSFLIQLLLLNKNFSLDESRKKGKKKVNCQSFTPFLPSAFVPSLSLFVYDLPPFFATFVFVFLLADASPFLLDFFLVAIIS